MTIIPTDAEFVVRVARDKVDVRAAQRLRYEVFVTELGGDGPMVDHENRLECDDFDADCDHLVLIDRRIDPATLGHVVGVYRLLPGDRVARSGRFYCDGEYDLDVLRKSGRKLLELGRSCVHPDHRGGAAIYLMWNALADYVIERGIEVLFGVASFHGTDADALAMPLSYLHHHHLAPESLRVTALPDRFQRMDMVPKDRIDRSAAMKATPALIKAYLRLGGFVGEGAVIDQAFNTTDVFLMMDTAAMSERHRGYYTRRSAGHD